MLMSIGGGIGLALAYIIRCTGHLTYSLYKTELTARKWR